MAIIPNPLNKFKSFNYRWSLGVLTAGELNDPSSYKRSGGNLIFIRSGGLPDKPVRTFIEEQLGINVEFFIDDVEIQSLVSFNPGTSTSTAMQIEFTVTEPYSIGLFFQTMMIAANQGGYRNYIEAPYVLSVDFIGHDDKGNIISTSKRTYAIKIVNITFSVDAGGSVYLVKAIPFNHIGFLDDYQMLNKNINASGDTVYQVLNNITLELNKQENDAVTTGQKLVGNLFKISFPNDLTESGRSSSITGTLGFNGRSAVNETNWRSVYNRTSSNINVTQIADIGFGVGQVDPSLARAAGLVSTGYGLGQVDPRLANAVNNKQTASVTNIERAINSFDPNQNYIGNSYIIPNFNFSGKVEFAKENEFYDEVNQIIKDANFSIDEKSRSFQFHQGSKIEKIIEAVILTSEWGQQLTSQIPDENNMVKWFKIDSKVNIISTDEMIKTGRPAMEFEYQITPYKVHYNLFSAPSSNLNYVSNMKNCVKGYNYSYTGLNTDIIDFEFKIDNSFYRPVVDLQSPVAASVQYAVSNANSTRLGTGPSGQLSADALANSLPGGKLSDNIQQNTVPYSSNFVSTGGGGIITDKKKLSELFNLIILNSDQDNIQLNLKIWGDPYYLSDSDSGNYRAGPSRLYINADDTVDFQRSEIDVLLRFNSAVDYKNNMMILDPNTTFSGIYKIVTFASSFSKGHFTQELTLLRRPQQTAEMIDVSNMILGASSSNSVELDTIIQERIDRVSTPFQPFISEISPEFHKFLRLGQMNISSFEKLGPVSNALQQAQGLINLGNQIKNNLLSTLGQIQGLPDNIDKSLNQIQNTLTDPINLMSQINIEGELQKAANKLVGPEIRQSINAVNKLEGTVKNLQNTVSQASAGITQISSNLNSIKNSIPSNPIKLKFPR